MFEKLKKRWEISSNWQLFLILVVFSITGSVSAWISRPFIELLGLHEYNIPKWILIIIQLIVIFPIYNVILITIGTLFGQFKFFWAFQKKMLRHFVPNSKNVQK